MKGAKDAARTMAPRSGVAHRRVAVADDFGQPGAVRVLQKTRIGHGKRTGDLIRSEREDKALLRVRKARGLRLLRVRIAFTCPCLDAGRLCAPCAADQARRDAPLPMSLL